MKVFQWPIIRFATTDLKKIASFFDHVNGKDWTSSSLDPLNRPAERGKRYFRFTPSSFGVSGVLCIYEREPDEWEIGNFVPDAFGQLTPKQVNPIVMSFVNIARRVECGALSVRIEVPTDTLSLESIVPPPAHPLLMEYVDTANWNSGASHPNDVEKFHKLIHAWYQTGKHQVDQRFPELLREHRPFLGKFADEILMKLQAGLDLLNSRPDFIPPTRSKRRTKPPRTLVNRKEMKGKSPPAALNVEFEASAVRLIDPAAPKSPLPNAPPPSQTGEYHWWSGTRVVLDILGYVLIVVELWNLVSGLLIR